MPDVPLHEYLAKIEEWIRSGEAERAVAHGRHILALYPECGWAHRILGEAYLEKGMLTEARESLERALGADPENAIAHIGLSLTYDRLGMLPEAIRQMERAFDVAAGNAAVRAELQALYERRGDSRSSGPGLTRGAMARVYAHNGMLERAIAEYQEALHHNPELLDARAGMAEAQWRAGRTDEALQTCEQLLARLPGCLKALLIQGQLLLKKGQEAESEAALALAQALDPENRLAQSMMGDTSPLPPREVLIPELAAVEVQAGGASDEEGKMTDEETGEEEGSPGAPLGAATGPAPGDVQASPAERPEGPPEEGEEAPEWLQELPRADTPGEGGEEEEAAQGEPAPGWMDAWHPDPAAGEEESGSAQTEAQREPPAWMGTLAEQTAAEEEEEVPPALPAEEEAGEEEAGAEVEPAEPEATPPAVATEVPDWVRRMEEAVTDEGMPAGAEVLGTAAAAAGPAATPRSGGSAAERQRIRELTLLLHQEPGKYWARIELARRCSQAGDWDGALLQYEELIAGHKMIRAVISDLQGLLREETDLVQVYRLLGDAYMESDQIDQALEMYRLARQILRKR